MVTIDGQPVLVTGASGFIGRRLVRRLVDGRKRVFCLVRANSDIHELGASGARLITGDVTDPGSTERALALSQAASVFHLAGLVRALRRDDFARVNTGGVRCVAAACAARAAPPTLVVVSSLAAAGPARCPRVESDVADPISAYGRSKLAGEHAAAMYCGTVLTTIVRPPIVFGAGDRAVLELFRSIARLGIHLVPGLNRGDRVSLVHVDDLVEGLLLAAERGERLRADGPPGQGVYYMASNEHPTHAELGQAIATALGQKAPAIVHLPGPLLMLAGLGGDLIAKVRRRPAWINSDKVSEALAGSWTCSSEKASTQLGWSPGAGLSARLGESAPWYRRAE